MRRTLLGWHQESARKEPGKSQESTRVVPGPATPAGVARRAVARSSALLATSATPAGVSGGLDAPRPPLTPGVGPISLRTSGLPPPADVLAGWGLGAPRVASPPSGCSPPLARVGGTSADVSDEASDDLLNFLRMCLPHQRMRFPPRHPGMCFGRASTKLGRDSRRCRP